MIATEYASALEHEWQQVQSLFGPFHDNRDLQGLYKLILQAKLPPDLHPDLKIYAQGLQYMAGFLREDFRILKQLHTANPTLIDTRVRGSTQAARDLERDFKLTWASWWDNDLNEGRILDSRNYEGQIGLGLKVERIRWEPRENEDGTSGCPIRIEDILVDTVRWHGNFLNPDAFWCRYTLPVIDCDVKNAKGERPAYGDGEVLGWVGESMPENFYQFNANKNVEVIVRDAVDPLAMCPLPGCNHRKRRITTYICKPGAKASEYEEVDCSDSPFEKCSFVVTGGDVCATERDPNEILRPSAWILMDLVIKHNFLFNSLVATFARELSDKRLYTNAGATNPETLQALTPEDDGQPLQRPDNPESSTIERMPGPVQMYPKPSTAELMELLRQNEAKYMLYRPNPNLTGQAAVSEVTGTAAVLNNQGAGMMLSANLSNWDTSHKRFFMETKHAICFTEYFKSADEQTKYIAIVSGRENVKGSPGKVGEEVYLDAKKCAHPVSFTAETSKDTPADRRDREERARTAHASGYFVKRQVYEAYGIQDIQAHEEELFAEHLDSFMDPMELRRIAGLIMALSASETGVDMGEETAVANLPIPDTNSPQTYNTAEANNSRLHTPPVELAPTTSAGMGGSSGLA